MPILLQWQSAWEQFPRLSGGCGSVAIHVREMARALGKLQEDGRIWKKGGEKPMSAYEYYGHGEVVGRKG